jgi:hypothetical protein
MASPPGERAIHLLVAVLHLAFFVGVISRAEKRHSAQQEENYPAGHTSPSVYAMTERALWLQGTATCRTPADLVS